MTPGTSRWLAPIGASAAVLAVFVVPGAIVAAGDAGAGLDHLPKGVGTPYGPVTPNLPQDGSGGADVFRVSAHRVEVTGYQSAGRRLRIFYSVDRTADCSVRIEKPRVEERDRSVVVRLAMAPSGAPDEVCEHLLLTSSVDVTLTRPLGDRVLQDASRGGALVPVEPPAEPPVYSGSSLATPPNERAGR